jgi:hypothetical protein
MASKYGKFGFKRFSEGGLGYEEDPPEFRVDRKGEAARKSVIKKSNEIKAVESKKESARGPSTRKSFGTKSESRVSRKETGLPSDRATGYRSQVEETGMTAEERKNLVKSGALAATTMLPAGRALRAGDKAYDAAKAAKAAQKAEDAVIEKAARGLSRRDMPSYSERYRARKRAEEQRAAKREGREPRAIPDWRGNIDVAIDRPGPGQGIGGNEVFKKGGAVRSKKPKSYFSNY